MLYIFGKLWHLAIIWPISKPFSYGASDFCWQAIVNFLEHLRPSHISYKGKKSAKPYLTFSLLACLILTIILGSQNVKGRRGRVSLILSEKIKLRVVWGECLLKVMLFCRMNLKWNWNLLKHSPLSSFNSFWVRRQVLMEHKVPPQTQSNFIIDIFAYTQSVNAKFRNQPLDHVK